MEPLYLMRRYTKDGAKFQSIEHNGITYYAFGDQAFPKDTVTNLTVYGHSQDHYTLEALVYLWHNLSVPHGQYVRLAASNSIRAITRIDRKHIQEWLHGEREDLPPNDRHLLGPGPPTQLRAILPVPEPVKAPRIEPPEERKPVEVRALNENLTIDKITELKRKRQMHQKKSIANTDESKIRTGYITNKDDQLQERCHKNRRTCLQGTRAFPSLGAIVDSCKKQWEINDRKRRSEVQPAQPTRGTYSRYAQENFAITDNAGFETEMSFIGSNLRNLQKVFQKPTSERTQNLPPPGKRLSRTPLIIVPAAFNSLITMYNARDILQDMVYISPDERKKQGPKPAEVVVQRTRNGKTCNIKVIDDVTRLKPEDWERVIACFVLGPMWQFKGWHWDGNPVEIFTNVRGFHLFYDNDKPAATVMNWNVQRVPVSRDKRHMDKARFGAIWDGIEAHIKKTKPTMCERLNIPV